MENMSIDDFEQKLREFSLRPEVTEVEQPVYDTQTMADPYTGYSEDVKTQVGTETVEDVNLKYIPKPGEFDTNEKLASMPDDLASYSPPALPSKPVSSVSPKIKEYLDKQKAAKESPVVAPAPEEKSMSDLRSELEKKYKGDPELQKQELLDAQKNRDQRTLSANLGEGLATIGSAIGRQKGKIDNDYYHNLRQNADSQIKDLDAQRKLVAEQLNVDTNIVTLLDKTLESQNKEARFDPNSRESKTVRNMLEASNPALVSRIKDFNTFSADAVDKYFWKLAELDLKAQENKLKSAERKDTQQEKMTTDWVARKTKEMGPSNKLFSDWQTISLQKDQMINALNNPSSIKDIGSTFGVIKSFDRGSTVREGEYALAAGSGGVFDKGMNALDKWQGTGQLQPEQRKAILDAIDVAERSSRNKYVKAVEPAMTEAKRLGISPDRFLPYPEEMEAGYQELQEAKKKKAPIAKQTYQDGQDPTSTRGKISNPSEAPQATASTKPEVPVKTANDEKALKWVNDPANAGHPKLEDTKKMLQKKGLL